MVCANGFVKQPQRKDPLFLISQLFLETTFIRLGYFYVLSDHVDRIYLSHISARLFTVYLYTTIEMASCFFVS
jgi:hypothetical protein